MIDRPTPRDVLWLSNCHQVRDIGVGGTDSIDRLTDAGIVALNAAGYRIVPKGAVEAERVACAAAMCFGCKEGWPLKNVGSEQGWPSPLLMHTSPGAECPSHKCQAAAILLRGKE